MKHKSGLERLLSSPWWICGGLAVAVFFTPQLNLLSVATSKSVFISSFTEGIHSAVELLVPYISGGLLILSLFIWINGRQNNKPAEVVGHWIAQLTAKNNNTVLDEAVVLDTGLKTRESKTAAAKPTVWNMDLLRQIEGNRFEELCMALFNELNMLARKTQSDADDCAGIELYDKNSPASLVAIAQCKADSDPVGETYIRAFYDVMVSSGSGKAYFVTTSSFTENAVEFSRMNGVTLINGEKLLRLITSRSAEKSAELLKLVNRPA